MIKDTNNRSVDHQNKSLLRLQLLDPLIQLINLNNQSRNRVEEPVENQRRRDQNRVALRLHGRFLVAEVLRGGARLGFATGSGLVLPVDVHKKEQTEGNNGEERLQQAPSHADEALAKRVQARNCQQEEHDCLRRSRVAQNNPFQSHFTVDEAREDGRYTRMSRNCDEDSSVKLG
ncbi:ubiquitin carboxyl-terminal hydrolase [Dorcoceras hygrometricum]|uniref:Ubiquitin carboxyl-terminal hydrolase n=1 Tax=Dorcoceras hygrometricum TaxID=472368 RepID=A0A2Z7BI88_9LAMI|nr:ubiquitin carboxyl-terminal hydrolase [Dorcoceras hygrometricum]